jgi:hypothetical protein
LLDLSSSDAGNISEHGSDEGSSQSDESDWASDADDDDPYKETDDEGPEYERGVRVMTDSTSSDDSIRVEFSSSCFSSV